MVDGTSQINPTSASGANDFFDVTLVDRTARFFRATADVTLQSECGAYSLSMDA